MIKSSENLKKLFLFSFGSADLSFLGFNLTQLLTIEDYKTRLITLKGCSLFYVSSSPALQMIPSIIKKIIKKKEFINPTLNSLIYFINEEIYEEIGRAHV